MGRWQILLTQRQGGGEVSLAGNRPPDATILARHRVHLDLVNPDPSAVDELVGLGATVAGEHKLPGGSHRWTVMHDPEGNEFCIAAKSFTGWD